MTAKATYRDRDIDDEKLSLESLYKLAVKLRVPVVSLFEDPTRRDVRRGRPPKKPSRN